MHGVQGLRHDWAWIPDRAAFITSAFATLAWRPDGVGAPRPYPTDYLLAMLDSALVALVGVQALFPLFMLAMAALVVYGARHLCGALGAPASARFGIALFALYNPWVYTEFVAGHLGMILAYGATMGFLGESLQPKMRPTSAALLICIAAAQLQLFLALIAYSALVACNRRGVLPFLTGLIVALPTIVGVIGHSSTLGAIPYNLTWESKQSLRPVEAGALTGYFADYVAAFTPVAFDAVWAMLALSAIGAIVSVRRKIAIGFLILGSFAWLWSTGVSGPIAALYSIAIVRVPALEIFRELYDLLAYVAIAYVALASMATASNRWLARSAVLPGLVLATTWCAASPLRWLVPLRDLPQVMVSAPDNSRIAFIPALQPLSFKDRGSGLDPDAYPRPNGVMPLNGLDVSFPANVALQRFALAGDSSILKALGVSRIYSRPWFATDVTAASAGFALSSPLVRQSKIGNAALMPLPELTTFPDVRITELPPPIGSATIFFGDGVGVSGPSVPSTWGSFERLTIERAPATSLLASNAWVDVRLAYAVQPEVGQGLGGLVTTSKSAYLQLKSGESALVWVRGRLVGANGRRVASNTHGYRWVGIGADIDRVRCEGECIVVGQGNVPVGIRPYKTALLPRPVEFSSPAPWFALAELPPNSTPSLLRYAIGYDPNWLGVTSTGVFAHVRVEAALNGWIVPPHGRPQRILLVEVVAAVQAFLELIALGWTLWLIFERLREQTAIQQWIAARA